MTAPHKGYFEFRLCPKKSAEELVTQKCLDSYLLETMDGTSRYQVTDQNPGYHYPVVKLPDDVVCDHCVIQWYYHTGIYNSNSRRPWQFISNPNDCIILFCTKAMVGEPVTTEVPDWDAAHRKLSSIALMLKLKIQELTFKLENISAPHLEHHMVP